MRLALGPCTSSPSTITSPRVYGRKPATIFSNVVFPQPTVQRYTQTHRAESPVDILQHANLPVCVWASKLAHKSRSWIAACDESLMISIGSIVLVTTYSISPLQCPRAFDLSHQEVQQPTDDADDHHASHNQVITLTCVTCIDDQIA